MLLETKLYAPRLQTQLIERPRLAEQLQTGGQQKLTLVSASAGFGKTTLVAHWLESGNRPYAWYSIDTNDNDLHQFFTYVIAALQKIHEGFGEKTRSFLQAQQAHPPEMIINVMVNEMVTYQTPQTLVLDDYHFITNPMIHEALNFLLDHLPPNLDLVIITRSDPPFSISRLRVRGQLVEIRSEDLRFSKQETQRFFNELMKLDLDASEITALEKRTEGWVAPLKLAALSLQETRDKQQFIRSFTGSNRYVVDYLIEEVLTNLPEKTRDFLLKTSILDRFCDSLCDAVTGETESSSSEQTDHQILRHLEQINLFLIPLDDERGWYRYHHLFGAFLRQQLQSKHADLLPELNLRASLWFEKHQFLEEAIDHAFVVGNMERTGLLIAGIINSYLTNQNVGIILQWIDQTPLDFLAKHPHYCTGFAWALLFTWKGEKLETMLELAMENKDLEPELPIEAHVCVIRVFQSWMQEDFENGIQLGHRALELLKNKKGKEEVFIRALAFASMAELHHEKGEIQEAEKYYSEAIEWNQKTGNTAAYLGSLGVYGESWIIRGDLKTAYDILKPGLSTFQTFARSQGKHSLAAPHVHLKLGAIHYEWNQLEESVADVQTSLELYDLGAMSNFGIQGYYQMVHLAQAKRDRDGAITWFKKLERLCEEMIDIKPFLSNRSSKMLLELKTLLASTFEDLSFLLVGMEQEINRLQQGTPDYLENPARISNKFSIIAIARFYLLNQRFEEAIDFLKSFIQKAEEEGRQNDVIKLYAFQVLAYQGQEQPEEAAKALSHALILAEPSGYIRSFVDCGVSMFHLLQNLKTADISSTYLSRLLAAFPEKTEQGPPLVSPSSEMPPSSQRRSDVPSTSFTQEDYDLLIEPLKEREIEILRALDGPLNQTEIAKELFLSTNTIKWYVKSIYGKLGVNSRREAVERAARLGVIPSWR